MAVGDGACWGCAAVGVCWPRAAEDGCWLCVVPDRDPETMIVSSNNAIRTVRAFIRTSCRESRRWRRLGKKTRRAKH